MGRSLCLSPLTLRKQKKDKGRGRERADMFLLFGHFTFLKKVLLSSMSFPNGFSLLFFAKTREKPWSFLVKESRNFFPFAFENHITYGLVVTDLLFIYGPNGHDTDKLSLQNLNEYRRQSAVFDICSWTLGRRL